MLEKPKGQKYRHRAKTKKTENKKDKQNGP